MKTILIKEGCPNPINLGEKGENGVSAVLFDYSEWLNDFGNGAISLLVKRKGDTAAYPVVLSTADGIATWTISDTDTAVQGYGKAEYVFTIDDKVAKSAVFSFYVAADLGPSGDPPDPYESWIDTLTALGGETLINAQAAQAAQTAAETAQTAAETAATNAATSATNAAQSAGAARDMAASALSSADRATASATAASGHATAAETAKDLAISAAEDAQHSETQAELSASAAAESAESASGSATTATTAATNAAASATSASGSASAAATSEANAEQSATSAAASATEAATEAAKLNNYLPVDTASGSIASFSDGADGVPVEALTVSLEPIQDLHGQSSPYPAGGGKNILAPTFYNGIGYNVAVGTVLTLTEATNVSVSGNTYTRTVREWGGFGMCSPQLATGTYYLMAELTSVNMRSSIYVLNSDMSVSRNLGNIGSGTTRSIGTVITLSGDEAYIAFNCLTASAGNVSISTPMVALSSSATSFAPYSNICPITGHTQAAVTRTNSNLAVFWQNGYVDASGNFVTSSGAINNGMCYPVPVKNGEYIRTTYLSGANAGLALFADSTLTRMVHRIGSGATYYRFTQDGYVVVWFNCGRAASQAVLDELNCQFAVTAESSLPTYEAPSVQHISIPLGQTVFGGTIDVVGGKCVVDRAKFTFSGSESWGLSGSSFFYTPLMASGVNVSDYYITENGVKLYLNGNNGQCRVYLNDNSFLSTSSDMHDYLTSTIGFVYKLATPIEIQLSDIPTISTLLGQNNIWSDSGDVDVTYRADIQKYITKVISEALA